MRYAIVRGDVNRSFPEGDPFRAGAVGVQDADVVIYLGAPFEADDAKAACTWMKTMTLTSTWLAAAKNRAAIRKAAKEPYTGLSTANSVADDKIFKTTYKPFNKYFDQAVKTVLQVQKYSFYIPASPASAEFRTAWTDAINRVLAGQQSVKAALNQAQREAQAAINKAK